MKAISCLILDYLIIQLFTSLTLLNLFSPVYLIIFIYNKLFLMENYCIWTYKNLKKFYSKYMVKNKTERSKIGMKDSMAEKRCFFVMDDG